MRNVEVSSVIIFEEKEEVLQAGLYGNSTIRMSVNSFRIVAH